MQHFHLLSTGESPLATLVTLYVCGMHHLGDLHLCHWPFFKVGARQQCRGPQSARPRVKAQPDETRRHRPGNGGGLGRRQSEVDRAGRARDPEDEAAKEAAGEGRATRKGRRRRLRSRNAVIVT